jgi:hypothetical protein
MKTPNSTLELGVAIESLVASYIESVRDAAQQAVRRAIASPLAPMRRSSSAWRIAAAKSSTTAARRTATELDALCDALCERVRAQPGASMVELAEQMGADVRSLQRPMSKLKSAARVRRVGQRHLTRYYPAVVRASSSGT